MSENDCGKNLQSQNNNPKNYMWMKLSKNLNQSGKKNQWKNMWFVEVAKTGMKKKKKLPPTAVDRRVRKATSFKLNSFHWDLLLDFMEKHPFLAECKNIHSCQVMKLWLELTTKLNGLGFGTKPTEKWKQIWTAAKLKAKRNIEQNKLPDKSRRIIGILNNSPILPEECNFKMTHKQWDTLISFMESHRQFACNMSTKDENYLKLWTELTKELNDVSTKPKTTEKWKKIWLTAISRVKLISDGNVKKCSANEKRILAILKEFNQITGKKIDKTIQPFTTNEKQWDVLLDFMEKYPNLHLAKNNEQNTILWNILANKLNELGDNRTVVEWKKIWTVSKTCAKKKMKFREQHNLPLLYQRILRIIKSTPSKSKLSKMEKFNSIKTNSQYEILLSFMENHKNFARTYFNVFNGNGQYDQLWSELTKRLNAHSVARKPVEYWQRFWRKLKLHARTKNCKSSNQPEIYKRILTILNEPLSTSGLEIGQVLLKTTTYFRYFCFSNFKASLKPEENKIVAQFFEENRHFAKNINQNWEKYTDKWAILVEKLNSSSPDEETRSLEEWKMVLRNCLFHLKDKLNMNIVMSDNEKRILIAVSPKISVIENCDMSSVHLKVILKFLQNDLEFEKSDEDWMELTNELNNVGKEKYERSQWQEIWSSYKSNLNKKLADTKQVDMFSDIEKEIIGILNLKKRKVSEISVDSDLEICKIPKVTETDSDLTNKTIRKLSETESNCCEFKTNNDSEIQLKETFGKIDLNSGKGIEIAVNLEDNSKSLHVLLDNLDCKPNSEQNDDVLTNKSTSSLWSLNSTKDIKHTDDFNQKQEQVTTCSDSTWSFHSVKQDDDFIHDDCDRKVEENLLNKTDVEIVCDSITSSENLINQNSTCIPEMVCCIRTCERQLSSENIENQNSCNDLPEMVCGVRTSSSENVVNSSCVCNDILEMAYSLQTFERQLSDNVGSQNSLFPEQQVCGITTYERQLPSENITNLQQNQIHEVSLIENGRSMAKFSSTKSHRKILSLFDYLEYLSTLLLRFINK